MIIIRNIRVSLDADFTDLKALVSSLLKVKLPVGATVKLYKRAVDARNKTDVFFNCAFVIDSDNQAMLKKQLRRYGAEDFTEPKYIFKKADKKESCIVVGFGPAGMFAALSLAKAGLCPIVLERGYDVDTRKSDVEKYFLGGALNPNSNIQFGEGGAGTFSDGKLNTGIKDSRIRTVLSIFAEHGAGEHILYDSKPHIGTDKLINTVRLLRREIISLGGTVLFGHLVSRINIVGGAVKSVSVETKSGSKELECDHLIMATGHSARDTYEMLNGLEVVMEPKPFAIGTRIEHLQSDVNKSQYGSFAEHKSLGAADYRLSTHLANNRGVFTFCMCPGGEVVNASSESGGVAVNGMSNSLRNGVNANSAVLVGVSVDDYYRSDVLDGLRFQREIEVKAFDIGKGKPICQTLGSFLKASENTVGRVKPTAKTGVVFDDIHRILPQFVTDALKEGILQFDKKLHGFADKEALLTAPETRSSSPVRIVRTQSGEASVKGLYPCGEGAGYAGGITSAAVDGLKIAEAIIERINNK